MSQITWTGSGSEKPATRSAGWGWSRNVSISSATIPATQGRSASTRRTVNALATSVRSLVCSGGSSPLMEPAAATSVPCNDRPGATARALENRWSTST